MKKITVIFGSPHKDGNTKRMLDLFLKYLNGKYKINFFDAYEEKVEPCIDCSECKKIGKCIFNDMQKMYDELDDCDYIIIASPIYNMSFPAPLKAIFDRFQLYYNFYIQNNGAFKSNKRKRIILLLTCGRKKSLDIIEKQLRHTLFYLNAEIISKSIFDQTDNFSDLNESLICEIKKASKLLRTL